MRRKLTEHMVVGVSLGLDEAGVSRLVFVQGDDQMLLLNVERARWLRDQLAQRLEEIDDDGEG